MKRIHGGVVLLRLYGLSSALKVKIVTETVQTYSDEMENAFTVIAHSSVRIRSELP